MDGFRSLFKTLRRVLSKNGRSPDEIDDLMQEAFLRLQAYCRERPIENTEAFLVRTVLNLSAQLARDSHPHQSLTNDPEALSAVDPSPDPDVVYAGQQRLSRVGAALNRLSPRSRQAFLMHRVDGMSYVQIAQELGVSVSMVEKHVARASFFLRDWLARSPQ